MDNFTISDSYIMKGICYRIEVPNTDDIMDAIDFIPTIMTSATGKTAIHVIDRDARIRPANVLVAGTDPAEKTRLCNIPAYYPAKIELAQDCRKIKTMTCHTSEKIKAAKKAFSKYAEAEKDIDRRLRTGCRKCRLKKEREKK